MIKKTEINEILQWSGTASFMSMYVLMSFFEELRPWSIIAGLIGGLLYLAWSIRVANKPQIITNIVGALVCTAGLVKYFGIL